MIKIGMCECNVSVSEDRAATRCATPSGIAVLKLLLFDIFTTFHFVLLCVHASQLTRCVC